MKLNKIKPFAGDDLQVIIETPKGSVYKYDYDPELDIFCLDKIMPTGMSFPYDFGFIPGTRGEDGDPLDVFVMMEKPVVQGSLLLCRVIGILEAQQTEKNGEQFRNDRILAVSSLSHHYKNIADINDPDPELLHELESFFKQYNLLAGKEFVSLGWKDAKTALQKIRDQTI